MDKKEYLKRKKTLTQNYLMNLEELDKEFFGCSFAEDDPIHKIFDYGSGGRGELATRTRAIHAFRTGLGIQTVGELQAATLKREDILGLRGMGYGTYRYILESLSKVGVKVY